jgi:archaellum component FlaC
MNAFLEGIGKFLGKFSDQIQGRIERLKNEKAELLGQLNDLKDKDCTALVAYKIEKIEKRIDEIKRILENNAKD